jgi:hypothetical protein
MTHRDAKPFDAAAAWAKWWTVIAYPIAREPLWTISHTWSSRSV